MSEIMTPGAPTGIPAGHATQSLSGGLPTLTLSDAVASADVIEFTGTLTVQDITVVIPQPLFPTQVASTASYSSPTALSWLKVLRNETSGNFNVVCKCLGGTSTLTVPQGQSLWVGSPDGLSIFAIGGGGGSGIGQNVVYRPGDPLGNHGNVYVTWGAAYNAANAPSLQGPITISVDDTLVTPAPIDPGVWDMDNGGRQIALEASNQFGSTTVTVPPTATLLNLIGALGFLQINGAPTHPLLPALAYTGAARVLFLGAGASLFNTGTVPLVNIGTATAPCAMLVVGTSFSGFFGNTVGSEVFNMPSPATLTSFAVAGNISAPANVILAGAGTVFWERRDYNSTLPIANVNFTGALNTQPDGNGPVNLTVTTPSVPAGATYVVDTLYNLGFQADQLIPCLPTAVAGLTLTLPDPSLPYNLGRTIRIVDASGHSDTGPISLTCPPAFTLNGVLGGPKALSSKWGQWVVVSDGTQWVVSQLSGV